MSEAAPGAPTTDDAAQIAGALERLAYVAEDGRWGVRLTSSQLRLLADGLSRDQFARRLRRLSREVLRAWPHE